MLTQTYPSIRKPAYIPPIVSQKKEGRQPNAADRSRALQFNTTPEEFVRRDDIVRQMFLDCSFHVGEVTEPSTEQGRKDYGTCTIRKIFRTYHDFPTASGIDWPKDDKPMIVTAEPEKKPNQTNMILCTPKYLRKRIGGGK